MSVIVPRLGLLLVCIMVVSACQREEVPPLVSAKPAEVPAIEETQAKPAPAVPAATPSTGTPAVKTMAEEKPAESLSAPLIFMQKGILLARGETIVGALPVWRRFAVQKPALLLLSNDPALLPPPAELQPQIANMMTVGSDSALRQAGNPLQPAPLFLPGMAVDLALRQGWLRELIWAFPQRDLEQEVKLETLREQLTVNRLADAGEAESLALDGKSFTARLRGVPFRAGALPNLPEPGGPLIVHIDLSYFQKLYKNEIATPVIPLVGSVLQQLKERKLPVLAVTFSYNHAEGGIPLDVRFLGEFIAGLTAKPERLDRSLPINWAAQKDILYLENFFQKDEIRKLVERQAHGDPKSAWVQYNRYHTAGLFKEGDRALAHLARAVALDRMYALEYLNLAQRAFDEAKLPDQALRSVKMAGAAFPENPLIKLQTAQLAMETGDPKTARTLVKELQRLPWSPVYYPGMPNYLEGFLAEIEK